MAMVRLAMLLPLILPACADDDCCTGVAIDAALHDTEILPDAPNGCMGPDLQKIKFTREQSCNNDGSVEWCIPDNDAQLMTILTNISSTIHCALGGGRAGCFTPSGRLLCTYPTSFPDQCLSYRGEMKPEVWDDICQVAAQPQITEIVPTIFE
jgi:hypothetical protein